MTWQVREIILFTIVSVPVANEPKGQCFAVRENAGRENAGSTFVDDGSISEHVV
jgi:hypothetical protein